MNGKVLAQGSQFSLNDVEVITATVDLEDVRSYRTSPSRGLQAIQQQGYERIQTDISLSGDSMDFDPSKRPTDEIKLSYHRPEEEIA